MKLSEYYALMAKMAPTEFKAKRAALLQLGRTSPEHYELFKQFSAHVFDGKVKPSAPDFEVAA